MSDETKEKIERVRLASLKEQLRERGENLDSESSEQRPNRKLAVIYRSIDSLILDARNPRLHKPRQIKQIAKSIQTFGFNVPVLIDESLHIVAGHGRVLASKQLGIKEIPTISLSHLTEEQKRAFMIADNRLTEISIWDDQILSEQLKELTEVDLNFDIEVIGFDMGEIDLRIQNLSNDELAEEAEEVIPSSGPPISQLGDVWILGPHRLICGNALESQTYHALMQGDQASMIFTDPPYNVKIDGNVSGLGSNRHREFAMASGEMTEAEFIGFLKTSMELMVANSAKPSVHYLCMDWRHIGEMLSAATLYSELLNVCVWTKDNAGMGSFYRSQHEFIFLFKNGNGSHRNNVQLGKNGRNRSNVWSYPGLNSFARYAEEGNLLDLHPTVKPIRLVADAILDASRRNDIVLDPFMGSGTTLLAAERTGRRCYGIEIDPLYVDTIIRRWQMYTGSDAVQASSSKTFNSLLGENTDE